MTAAEWHLVRAFGLDFACEWPLPGSSPVAQPDPGSTRVRRIDTAQLDARTAGPAQLIQERRQFGETVGRIERDDAQFRFDFKGFGRYLVTLDGMEIACETAHAPVAAHERWVWAQMLPLAAALRGRDLLHASAVSVGGGVVAFLGPSGRGKTTIMAGMVERGAGFVTDDVLNVETGDGTILAHSGPPFVGVVDGGEAALDVDAARLGRVVGTTDKVHVSLATVAEPMPLERLYHLEVGPEVQIAPFSGGGAAVRLLSAAFAPYADAGVRLERHLALAHRLAQDVPEFRLQIPREHELTAALDAVDGHLSAVRL